MASAERIGLGIGILVAIVLIGATIFSIFAIARPMQALTGGMLELAGGNFDVVLPGLGRKDEIGDVAGAVETFKVKAAEKAQARRPPRPSRTVRRRPSARPRPPG